MQQPRHAHARPRRSGRIFSFARSLRYFPIVAILQHRIVAESRRGRFRVGSFLG